MTKHLFVKILAFLIVMVGRLDAFSVPSSSLEEQWSEFKMKFNRTYLTKIEHDRRKLIFSETLAKITEHNANYDLSNPNATHFKLKLNEFGKFVLN